jgi:trigger factor
MNTPSGIVESNLVHIDEVTKKVVIKVPLTYLDSEAEKELISYAPQAEIKGFRPGKAPQHLVKKRYGNKVRQNLLNSIINKEIQELVKTNNLKVVSDFYYDTPDSQESLADATSEEGDVQKEIPSVESLTSQAYSQTSDNALTYALRFSIYPVVDLVDWKGLEISVPQNQASEEKEVEDFLKNIRIQNQSLEQIEGGGLAYHTNWVDFLICSDSVPNEELESIANTIISGIDAEEEKKLLQKINCSRHSIVPADGQFSKGVTDLFLDGIEPRTVVVRELKTLKEDVLEDTSADQKEVNDEGSNEALNKSQLSKIYILDFKERVLPEISDELAKKYDNSIDTIDQLIAKFKTKREEYRRSVREEYIIENFLNQLLEKNPLKVPRELVISQVYNIVNSYFSNKDNPTASKQIAERLISDALANPESYLFKRGIRQAQQRIIASTFVDLVGIKVSDEELESEFLNQVRANRDASEGDSSYDEIARKYLNSSQELTNGLREQLLKRKVFETITQNVKIIDVDENMVKPED